MGVLMSGRDDQTAKLQPRCPGRVMPPHSGPRYPLIADFPTGPPRPSSEFPWLLNPPRPMAVDWGGCVGTTSQMLVLPLGGLAGR